MLVDPSVQCHELRREHLFERRDDRAVIRRRREGLLFFAELCDDVALPLLDLLNLLARFLEAISEDFFRDFVRADLYHVDEAILAARDEVHAIDRFGIATGRMRVLASALGVRGVDDKARAVHPSDADSRDRPIPWDIGSRKRERSRVHRENVGIVLFNREDGDDDLYVTLQPLGEERANGAINDATRKDCLVRRSAFTPHESAAKDGASRVELLLIFDGERKIIFVGFAMAHYRSRENGAVAVAQKHRAIGLVRPVVELGGHRLSPDLEGVFFFLHGYWSCITDPWILDLLSFLARFEQRREESYLSEGRC